MSEANPDEVLLVAHGGVTAPKAEIRDPFAELDDLMTVIEALCPEWPARPFPTGKEIYKL